MISTTVTSIKSVTVLLIFKRFEMHLLLPTIVHLRWPTLQTSHVKTVCFPVAHWIRLSITRSSPGPQGGRERSCPKELLGAQTHQAAGTAASGLQKTCSFRPRSRWNSESWRRPARPPWPSAGWGRSPLSLRTCLVSLRCSPTRSLKRMLKACSQWEMQCMHTCNTQAKSSSVQLVYFLNM